MEVRAGAVIRGLMCLMFVNGPVPSRRWTLASPSRTVPPFIIVVSYICYVFHNWYVRFLHESLYINEADNAAFKGHLTFEEQVIEELMHFVQSWFLIMIDVFPAEK
jgi:hypothetical protein